MAFKRQEQIEASLGKWAWKEIPEDVECVGLLCS